jgi:gluconokinase
VNNGSIFILVGVSGCGKTTLAQKLAQVTDGIWFDSDDYLPAHYKARMSAGTPLTDEDRWPWLELLNQELHKRSEQGKPVFLACSALKQKYRDRLMVGLTDVRIVYLKGSHELIAARLAVRKGHFMPAMLLDSQFATLEEPTDALVIDISKAEDQMVQDFVRMA